MIHRLISQLEITRDNNYNIDIQSIKFTDEFITKNSKWYLKYLNGIILNDNIGIKFHEEINKEKLNILELNYDILLSEKIKNSNQLERVKLMNNYKNMAEEVILKELIHV